MNNNYGPFKSFDDMNSNLSDLLAEVSAEVMKRLYPPSQYDGEYRATLGEEHEDDHERFMERTEGVNYKYNLIDCHCPDFPEEPCECGSGFRDYLMKEIQISSCKFMFKNYVLRDVIIEAMHPRRIQAQMDQFDDIETYFTQLGY